MKVIIYWIASFIAVLAFAGIVLYGMRMWNMASTPLTLQSPKPGITCASMVLNDGVALSCWKD